MVAKIKASFKILGVDELIRSMRDWKRSVRKRVIYNAVRKCGPVIKRAIKPLVPRESGTLKKSIAHKVYTHRSGDGAGIVVGPRKGFSQMVTVRTKGRLRGRYRATKKAGEITATQQRKRAPDNYSHLVEFGHRIAQGGTLIRLRGGKASKSRRTGIAGLGQSGGTVQGAHYMSRGWKRALPQVQATIRRELESGIRREAQRAAAKHGGRR